MSVLPSRSRCDRLAERRWAATAGPSSHEMPSVPTTLLAAGGLGPRADDLCSTRTAKLHDGTWCPWVGPLRGPPPARAASAGRRLTAAVLATGGPGHETAGGGTVGAPGPAAPGRGAPAASAGSR